MAGYEVVGMVAGGIEKLYCIGLISILWLQEVTTHGLKSPTLLMIGSVVALSPGWHMAESTGCSLQDGRSYDPIEFSSLLGGQSSERPTAV